MRWSPAKTVLVGILVLAILSVGLLALFAWQGKPPATIEVKLTEIPAPVGPRHQTIGLSVENRPIEAYAYGNGKTQLVFVGGVHGGYEWNSVLLAYQFIDYLNKNPKTVPTSLTITVIPDLNPDGVFAVTGKTGRFIATDISTNQLTLIAGRFNADQVDLNRNLDCRWVPKSTWQNKTVSAGSKPFSEPEAAAFRDFVLEKKPAGVVFWHSQANAVYASACQAGILPATLDMMNIYSRASGYPAVKSFDSYATTGAADDWLASINIPAITVELQTHETIEWERNLAGIKALMGYYRQKI